MKACHLGDALRLAGMNPINLEAGRWISWGPRADFHLDNTSFALGIWIFSARHLCRQKSKWSFDPRDPQSKNYQLQVAKVLDGLRINFAEFLRLMKETQSSWQVINSSGYSTCRYALAVSFFSWKSLIALDLSPEVSESLHELTMWRSFCHRPRNNSQCGRRGTRQSCCNTNRIPSGFV